ncbi:MAG TPA: WYL domain-containing protein [Nocardioides sp.]|uniref:WYL domain-containing protein n=1 Tax=Nocardioides sp. TaxID=35761 RepID=UPI002EDAD773
MAQGRPQRGPMERLVRLTAVLSEAGESGVAAEKLMAVAGFDGDAAADQLARELAHLRRHGWQIDNVAPVGMPAVWRLRVGDSRLRLRLDDRHQAALQRAVLMADRHDLVERLGLPPTSQPPEVDASVQQSELGGALGVILRAVQQRAVLRFRYGGKVRVLHPASVKHQNSQWYLSAREDGADEIKHFVVGRMSQVSADEPRTADRVEPVGRLALHPLRWQVDPPLEVVLEVAQEFVPDVVRWLQEPSAHREVAPGVEHLTYVVTNRSAMRSRLYLLGERVRIVGPDEFRAELIAELSEMAGV